MPESVKTWSSSGPTTGAIELRCSSVAIEGKDICGGSGPFRQPRADDGGDLAHRRGRDSSDSRGRREAVDEAAVDAQLDRHAGLAEALPVGDALVAQWVEPADGNVRRRRAAQVRREERS